MCTVLQCSSRSHEQRPDGHISRHFSHHSKIVKQNVTFGLTFVYIYTTLEPIPSELFLCVQLAFFFSTEMRRHLPSVDSIVMLF